MAKKFPVAVVVILLHGKSLLEMAHRWEAFLAGEAKWLPCQR